MPAEALEGIGFAPGTKQRQQVPSPGAGIPEEKAPGPPAAEMPPSPSERSGFQSRLHRLREMAAGSRRPLGSPEGPATLPRSTNPSPGSVSNPRRITENAAVTIRQGSIWLDWLLGRFRPDCDWVATAEESYAIAAPLAGYIVDHIPETGPLAELAEKAGLVGAGSAAGTYLARAAKGIPGGRVESEALRERVLRRMGAAKERRVEADAPREGEAAAPEPPAHTLAGMLGDDDEEPMGIGVPV